MTSNEEETSSVATGEGRIPTQVGVGGQPVAVRAAGALDFIRTTEGHLDELTSVLQRMRVLSIQSANGTYSEEDRSAIQIEVDQLTDEIARVADQADFNRMKTLRVHVGANTNEALAVNIFAADVQHLFAGEAAAPADQGAAAPADQQGGAGAQGGAGVAGPVNVMTAIDANSSIAKIDVAIKSVTDQRSNLGAFSNRLESAIRRSSADSATDTADKLLEAIGAEAQRVADKSAGQTSADLLQLARAYAVTTFGTSAVRRDGVIGPDVGDEVLVGFEHGRLDRPFVLGGLYNGVDAPTDHGLPLVDAGGARVSTRASNVEGASSHVAQTQVPVAAEDSRGKLLDAIGREAQLIAESPGQAATALAELARAYALATTGTMTARTASTPQEATTFALIYGLPLLSYSHLASKLPTE
ncbi:phage baseplate assembly protein V [Streptomyces noboritoensis]|uniref:Flagellin n=1 Tax=Streptomyces noboritoensis TaxID=67337 RepID=A0ABV6TBS5_9ACTN